MIHLLLFDDIPDHRDKVNAALSKALGGRGNVVEFTPNVGPMTTSTHTHEARLTSDLQNAPNKEIDLIVADRDLSAYGDNYRGLSEGTVRQVADTIGVPECGYARGERNDDEDYVKRGDFREACIRLSLKPDIDAFAKRVVAIADGFLEIAKRLAQLKEGGRQSPGKLLANVLSKPEYSEKISLYSSGDQNRLAAVVRLPGTEQQRRLACMLGYWLWDSVLRFPGVTLGVIPASSYLNIRQDVFAQDSAVQKLFAAARYSGPFAAAKVEMWWRGMLDDIVAKSGCEDGRHYASKQLKRDVPRSECCEDHSLPAGYYCMFKEKPVSLKNSKGGLPWFPRGADLARVSTSALEELGPWL